MKTFPAPKSRNWNVLISLVKWHTLVHSGTASAIDFWLLFLLTFCRFRFLSLMSGFCMLLMLFLKM